MDCSTPGFPVPHHLPKFAQVHVHCIGDATQPSHPLTPSSPLPSIFPSIRDFSNEADFSHQMNKTLELQLQHQSLNEYSGLIFFRIDWFDLLAVQGTLKSLLQHHSSKAAVLQCSAFFMVQLSQPYMITGKTIALTIQTFVGKVISLLYNVQCSS